MSDKDVRLPFDGFPDPEIEANEPANDFWEDIAETLDKIEQNTRESRFSATGKPDNSSSPQAASRQSRQTAPTISPPPRQREQSSEPVAGPSTKTPSVSSTSRLAEQNLRPGKKSGEAQAEKLVASTHVSNAKADEKKKQTTEIRRLEAVSKQQTNGILKQLKTGLSNWDGSVGGMKLNMSNIGDMVGMALGGPFWTAFKELKDIIIQDSQNSEKSLSSLFKKTFPRKQEGKAHNGRQRDSNGRFIGGDNTRQQLKFAEDSHALAEQQVATGKKRHDELVKAVKANRPKTNLFGRGGLLDTFRGRGGGGLPGFGRDRRVVVPDARMPHGPNGGRGLQGGAYPPAPGKSGKPHGRGRKAGLLAGAGVLFGGSAMYMGSRGDNQSAIDTASSALDTAHTATQGSKAAAEKTAAHSASKVAEAGAKASTIDATAQTATQGGKAVAEKTAGSAAAKTAEAGARTAATAGKAVTVAEAGAGKAATSAGGKVAALGAKGAMGAAKAIPIAGQLLAAGMAVYDGINGWNDTEMHQQAFGLQEGEEASTGQKASAAAANVLDMGGLLTGAASLFGFDVSTADIAKGIYDIGDKVGEVLSDPVGSIAKATTGLFDGIKGFFGGGGKDKGKEKEEKDEKSPKSETRNQSEETSETSTADIARTAALVAAPAGIVAAATMRSGSATLPVAETPTAPSLNAQNAPKASKKGISPLAVGAVGVAGAAGIYAGTKAILSDEEKDKGKGATKADTMPGSDKIPSLLESLTKALTDLTEKLEQQIKQATTSEGGGVFNIFSGGGSGGGGYSGSGGGGSYSSGGGHSSSGGGHSSSGGGGSAYSSNVTYSGLGDVVLMSETSGKGTAMISSGKGDKGGVSYGRSQLASKAGSIPAALKWARANGYEDIANELEPLMGDATNRNGQFAQKWAQLAADKGGRLEQFDKAYKVGGYYNPLMTKIRKENPELAKRIDANPALQEQVLSTAVQYGPYSSRYLSAANEVLSKNANATDRELLTGIQDIKVRDVGINFAHSSADVKAGVANRHRNTEMKGLLAIQDRFERGEIKIDPKTGTGQAQAVTSLPNKAVTAQASLLASPTGVDNATSQGLANFANTAIANKVKYDRGWTHGGSDRTINNGVIDCSGFASEGALSAMLMAKDTQGRNIYGDNAIQFMEGLRSETALGQRAKLNKTVGGISANSNNIDELIKSGQIKEGMMLTMRKNNGDGHAGYVYRDPQTQQLMVADSALGGNWGGQKVTNRSGNATTGGIRTSTLDSYVKGSTRNGRWDAQFHDITKLANKDVDFSNTQQPIQTAVAEAKPEEKAQPAQVASAEQQQTTNTETQQTQKAEETQAAVVAEASKSVEAANAQAQQVAEAMPKAIAPAANTEPVSSPSPQVPQSAPAQSAQQHAPSQQPAPTQVASAEPAPQRSVQKALKPVALAQNGPIQSMQTLLSQTGALLSNIPGVSSDFLAPVQNVMGKAQAAMDMVKSPQAMIENFLPKEAQPFVANVQKVAGDLMPLASSVGSLLPGSASPFLSGAQNILGQIAKPQFSSSLPDPTQFFGQPLQAASNVMQAMPQIPTRLPDPAALMPTQSMQQGNGFDFGPIVNVLTELLDVTRKNTKDKEKETEEQNTSNIPMDFDDAYCFRFAHDMA